MADPAWRSGRAFPLPRLVSLRILGAVGLLFAGLMTWSIVGPLSRGEEARFTVNGEPRVATPEDLAPALPVLGIALLFALLFGGLLLLVDRENRRGPATWTVTPRGLVRRRGDQTRTIPWGRFTHVEPVRTARTRGHVRLWTAAASSSPAPPCAPKRGGSGSSAATSSSPTSRTRTPSPPPSGPTSAPDRRNPHQPRRPIPARSPLVSAAELRG